LTEPPSSEAICPPLLAFTSQCPSRQNRSHQDQQPHQAARNLDVAIMRVVPLRSGNHCACADKQRAATSSSTPDRGSNRQRAMPHSQSGDRNTEDTGGNNCYEDVRDEGEGP